MRKWLFALALILPGAATATAQTASPDALLVQQLIDGAREPCRTQPAQVCVDIGFWFAASDPDRGLSLDDVVLLRQRLGAWFQAYQETLVPRARTGFGLGFLLADGMTIPKLHGSFDSNGDGYVSQAELLADVTLDQRPLGQVLSDPDAVDRVGLANRLGLPPAMLDQLFQK
ncbi:MAG: hypothetical protein O3B22_02800 [Proteobacteria bacterium]|nr:hypothetical protein [Pseudomonadota bacterium]